MAKQIIAANVPDIPEILGGCGWITEPENPKQLTEAIKYVFDYLVEASKMGLKAREKCIREYSWKMIEKKLIAIFEKYKMF